MLHRIKKIITQNTVLTVALLVTCIVYSKFLFFGHISWDDPEMVFKNRYVKSFDVYALFTQHFVGNYLPLTMLTHAITWLLFEANDWGHHLISILIHLLNGILVFRVGKLLFKSTIIANMGVIIFLLHPLQVESVAWISELKNILSTTFLLLAILAYMNFIEQTNNKYYFFCLVYFILGCLSKSSVVVFPLLMICIDVFKKHHFNWKMIPNKILFFVLAILFGGINLYTQKTDLFINHAHEFPYYIRFGFAGFALLKYFVLFVFPINLSVIYPYPDKSIATIITGYIGLTLILGLMFLLFNKKNYPFLLVILFIIISLILVLQLIPFGEALYADRYMYVPLIGFGWLLGIVITKLQLGSNKILFSLIAFVSIFSYVRGQDWKTAINLYEDINKKYPNQFLVLNSAGVESMFLGADKKAFDYLNQAVKIAPSNYKGYYNLGLLYLKNNEAKKAINEFNKSIGLFEYSKAYVGRASAYYMLSDFPKAINDANYALELDTKNSYIIKSEEKNAKAHFVIGNCYNDLNRLDDALKEYNRCIELNNTEAEFYFKRAIVYGKKQDFEACIREINICLFLNPNHYEAYYWRGVAKVNLKQNACEDLKIAAQKNYQPAINAYNKFCR